MVIAFGMLFHLGSFLGENIVRDSNRLSSSYFWLGPKVAKTQGQPTSSGFQPPSPRGEGKRMQSYFRPFVRLRHPKCSSPCFIAGLMCFSDCLRTWMSGMHSSSTASASLLPCPNYRVDTFFKSVSVSFTCECFFFLLLMINTCGMIGLG